MARTLARLLASTILGLPMLVTGAMTQPQQVIACGAVIDTPGTYELADNLSCPLGLPPPAFCDTAAITITASHVRLKGRGFTISGNQTGVGIRVAAADVHLQDVTVERFNIGIELTGGGGHRLIDVASLANSTFHCGDGVGVQMTNTSDSLIDHSTVSRNERWGVRLVSSARNRLVASDVSDNRFRPGRESGNVDMLSSDENDVTANDLSRGGLWGVRLQDSGRNAITANVVNDTATPAGIGIGILVSDSAHNVVQANRIDRAPAPGTDYIGVLLFGSATGNAVRANRVFHHTRNGIFVFTGATGNVLEGNRAFDNTPFDAADDNPGCDANTWRGNQFGLVSQPACIR
jgi:parallel beta-helix repeat protein